MTVTFVTLYEKAKSVLNPLRLSEYAEASGVGAVILTEKGVIYISQLHSMNINTKVMVAESTITTIQELLPHNWKRIIQRIDYE
jgi:hypothetical protein